MTFAVPLSATVFILSTWGWDGRAGTCLLRFDRPVPTVDGDVGLAS